MELYEWGTGCVCVGVGAGGWVGGWGGGGGSLRHVPPHGEVAMGTVRSELVAALSTCRNNSAMA
jgi:hypothetical protein